MRGCLSLPLAPGHWRKILAPDPTRSSTPLGCACAGADLGAFALRMTRCQGRLTPAPYRRLGRVFLLFVLLHVASYSAFGDACFLGDGSDG